MLLSQMFEIVPLLVLMAQNYLHDGISTMGYYLNKLQLFRFQYQNPPTSYPLYHSEILKA